MTKRKPTLVEQFLNEYVLCGECLCTRGQLYQELMAQGHEHNYVDAFVFGYLKPASPEMVEEAKRQAMQEQ